jgi:threo-3-hydroxy-L-aspartate ammonia-lyase
MPEDTPPVKLAATRGYGAEIVTYDRYSGDREALGAALALDRELVLIPPYEHPDIMAGQGTTALELLADSGPLDILVTPVGGGGLIAGCSTAAKGLQPDIRVVGVEPEAGDDTRRSLEAGERIRIPVPRTIADGLQSDIPGELTFSVNQQLVDEIVTVSDTEIVEAMRFLLERMKVLVEPSGAVAVAALLAGRIEVAGLRVGLVLSGGNIDLARLCDLLG